MYIIMSASVTQREVYGTIIPFSSQGSRAASEVWPGKELGQVLSGLSCGQALSANTWDYMAGRFSGHRDTPGLSRRHVGSAEVLTLQGQLSAHQR